MSQCDFPIQHINHFASDTHQPHV